MGDCTYYFKAQFKTPAQAKKALPKITAFINEIREAYNFWHQYPSVNEKLFWNQFGRDFPLTNIYLVSLGAEASQALNCHSDLSGKLDFGQDEYNEPVINGNIIEYEAYNVWHFSNWGGLIPFFKEKFGAVKVVVASEEDGCGNLESLQLYEYQEIVEAILKKAKKKSKAGYIWPKWVKEFLKDLHPDLDFLLNL